MSANPPPTDYTPQFNPSSYITSDGALTISEASRLFLKLTGGVVSGLTVFDGALATDEILNGAYNYTMPSSSGQLALVADTFDLAEGSLIDISGTTTKTIACEASVLSEDNLKTLTNKSFQAGSCFWTDATDDSKKIGFVASGSTTGTTLNLISSCSVSRNITFPNATDQVVCLATGDNLSNKTLNNSNCYFVDNAQPFKRIAFQSNLATSPTTLTLSSTTTSNRTLTFPDATDTLLGRATVDNLTSKSLITASCAFVDNGDNTKRIAFGCASSTTATTMTLSTATTSNRTITIPDATDTLATLAGFQALSNKTWTSGQQPLTIYQNTSNQSIPNGTSTKLTFPSSVVNQSSAASYSSGNFTMNIGGTYLIIAACVYDGAVATFPNQLWLNLNGTIYGLSSSISAGIGQAVGLNATAILTLAVSDVVSAFAYQGTGGSVNILGSVYPTRMTMFRLC